MSWPVVKIDEISELVTKGTTPTTYGMPFTDEGINFIKAESLNGDTSLNRSGFTYVSEDTHNKLSRSILQVNDVLLTIAGANVGACGFVTENDIPANTNQAVSLIRIIPEKANPRFIYYYFKRPQMKALCLNIGGQSAQPNVNLGNVKNFDVPLPAIGIQNKIVEVLSAYDDLIENNRRRIALLEESARLLYREWFVHLRFPGHETTKIIDGVPEGWSHGVMEDLFQTSSGGTPSRKKPEFYGGTVNWLKTQELNGDFIFGTKEKITEAALRGSSAKLFDANTVIVAMYGATIGELCILAEPSATNQACCALIPKKNPKDYVFAFTMMDQMKSLLKDRGQGSAQNNVSQQVIKNLDILVPSREILDKFNEVIEPNFLQRKTLQKKALKLAQARDILLPRLMDGRIEL